jgi:hypothetical protein
MASDWPGRDKNVPDLNAPFALSKNQSQDIEDEIDAKLSLQQLDILRRNSFVNRLRDLVLDGRRGQEDW